MYLIYFNRAQYRLVHFSLYPTIISHFYHRTIGFFSYQFFSPFFCFHFISSFSSIHVPYLFYHFLSPLLPVLQDLHLVLKIMQECWYPVATARPTALRIKKTIASIILSDQAVSYPDVISQSVVLPSCVSCIVVSPLSFLLF